MELNVVPYKFFQQLLKDLYDAQPNARRHMSHWRPLLLNSVGRKLRIAI